MIGFSHASRGMQKCFVVAHYRQDTIYVCFVQIKYILRNSWQYQWWILFSILGCMFYHFIVLDTVWKCPDCKKRDIWQNRRPSDYPLPCLCQRRHHILWCFKRGHLRLERAHPGPNHSRGTQCEYCRMVLRGGVLNTLGPPFSCFCPLLYSQKTSPSSCKHSWRFLKLLLLPERKTY